MWMTNLFTKTHDKEDVSTIQSYGKTPLKIYCNHILTRHICIMKLKFLLWTNENFHKKKEIDAKYFSL
jgi:hypothetical protein